jgi:hypothetical protein
MRPATFAPAECCKTLGWLAPKSLRPLSRFLDISPLAYLPACQLIFVIQPIQDFQRPSYIPRRRQDSKGLLASE